MGASHTMRAEVNTLADALRRSDAAGVRVTAATIEPGAVSLTLGEEWDLGPMDAQLTRGRRRRYLPRGEHYYDQDTGEEVQRYRGPRRVYLTVRGPSRFLPRRRRLTQGEELAELARRGEGNGDGSRR